MKFKILTLCLGILLSTLSQSAQAGYYITGFMCVKASDHKVEIADLQVEGADQGASKPFLVKATILEPEVDLKYTYFDTEDEARAAANADCKARGGVRRYAGGQIESD